MKREYTRFVSLLMSIVLFMVSSMGEFAAANTFIDNDSYQYILTVDDELKMIVNAWDENSLLASVTWDKQTNEYIYTLYESAYIDEYYELMDTAIPRSDSPLNFNFELIGYEEFGETESCDYYVMVTELESNDIYYTGVTNPDSLKDRSVTIPLAVLLGQALINALIQMAKAAVILGIAYVIASSIVATAPSNAELYYKARIRNGDVEVWDNMDHMAAANWLISGSEGGNIFTFFSYDAWLFASSFDGTWRHDPKYNTSGYYDHFHPTEVSKGSSLNGIYNNRHVWYNAYVPGTPGFD